MAEKRSDAGQGRRDAGQQRRDAGQQRRDAGQQRRGAGRPARAALSVERIAAQAVAIADRDGLEALSMRRLAEELGVEAMSLYHHVPSKAALLEVMADALARELPEPPLGDWRDCLTATARVWRDLARRHPGAFVLLATRATIGAALLERAAVLIERLQTAGFSATASARALSSLFTALDGFLLAAGEPAVLRDVPEAHADGPALEAAGAALAAVPAQAWLLTPDEAFDFHLLVLLDGLEAALRRERGERAG
jgi:AcrR family transcriptional regulator